MGVSCTAGHRAPDSSSRLPGLESLGPSSRMLWTFLACAKFILCTCTSPASHLGFGAEPHADLVRWSRLFLAVAEVQSWGWRHPQASRQRSSASRLWKLAAWASSASRASLRWGSQTLKAAQQPGRLDASERKGERTSNAWTASEQGASASALPPAHQSLTATIPKPRRVELVFHERRRYVYRGPLPAPQMRPSGVVIPRLQESRQARCGWCQTLPSNP